MYKNVDLRYAAFLRQQLHLSDFKRVYGRKEDLGMTLNVLQSGCHNSLTVWISLDSLPQTCVAVRTNLPAASLSDPQHQMVQQSFKCESTWESQITKHWDYTFAVPAEMIIHLVHMQDSHLPNTSFLLWVDRRSL